MAIFIGHNLDFQLTGFSILRRVNNLSKIKYFVSDWMEHSLSCSHSCHCTFFLLSQSDILLFKTKAIVCRKVKGYWRPGHVHKAASSEWWNKLLWTWFGNSGTSSSSRRAQRQKIYTPDLPDREASVAFSSVTNRATILLSQPSRYTTKKVAPSKTVQAPPPPPSNQVTNNAYSEGTTSSYSDCGHCAQQPRRLCVTGA